MTRRYHFFGCILAPLALWAVVAMATEEEHGGHADEHGGGGDDEMPEVIHFTVAQRQALGITSETAGPAHIAVEVRLVGEVVLNLDRTAHVTSRVPGLVSRIERSYGDRVAAGEVMAVLDSRDLAQARATFLTSRARVRLMRTTFDREEALWREQISSESEYLAAGQALTEANIAHRTAEQMLHALSVSQAELDTLPDDPAGITRYELTAPIGGTVIDRYATLGEMVSESNPVFLIADLGTVWVELAVHLDDLYRLHEGQPVRVRAGDTGPRSHGTIAFLSPVVDAGTRTGLARVVLANKDGRWRPSTPVSAWVTVDAVAAAVTVPTSALYELEGRAHVFIDGEDGIRLRPVTTSVSGERVAITDGLAAGESVITSGGVHVKAAFLAAGAGGHGH